MTLQVWKNSTHPKKWGPWSDEPDKAQWIDETTGLDCLIVRGPVGALCGYVGVGPDHPHHGSDYDRMEHWPEVHGGLTFAGACNDEAPEGHGICHIPEPGRPHDVWWFGFDCAHAGDWTPSLRKFGGEVYRTFAYVQAECGRLAAQLAEHGAPAQPGCVQCGPAPADRPGACQIGPIQ